MDERTSMAAIGDMNAYLRFKAAKSMQDAAQHGGAMGSLVGAGAGLGLGLLMPGMLGAQVPPAIPGATPAGPAAATAAAAAASPDPIETLQKLKGLLDAGAITAAEYETKKKELLARV
jgi:membrane protease subunit (stomatin/prohibitin family)